LAGYENEFISLHEVLCRLMSTDNSSYQEAAQALCKLLKQSSDDAPLWYGVSPTQPNTPLVEILIKNAFLCLEQAATYGVAPERPQNEDEQWEFQEFNGNIKTLDCYCNYGFDRKQICEFLKYNGLDIDENGLPPESFISGAKKISVYPDSFDSNRIFSEQINKCLRENSRLKQELESNKLLINKIDDLRKKTANIIADLEESTEALANITAERDRLQEDVDLGKTKKKYLEILGTLAIKGYRIDIHAKRIEGISKILNDMNLLGLSSNPKTVSLWLKMAAEVIDEPMENHLYKK
jgi:hypothetical protein